jgi:dTDP-4-dehydrorhamnose reductase
MRILLLGASGLAGGVLWSHFVVGGHDVVGTQLSDGVPELVRLDLLDDAALTELALGPFDLVVHAAGLVDLVPAEAQPQLAWRMNVRSVEVLLTALERSRAKLVFLSSDNVFDGTRETCRERDEPSPINVYGETKVAAERLVLRDPRHLVLRIPMLYGASPFSNTFLGRFARPRTLAQVDVVCAPLYLPSLAAGIPDLWERAGLLHLGGAEVVTRFELMSRIQAALGLASEVVPVHDDGDRPGNVRRPRRLVLRSEHHDIVGPDLETALAAWAPAEAG